MSRFQRDPNSVLDWAVDWTAWLAETEAITSHQVLADPGITVDSDSRLGPVVTVWLSGGTANKTYGVTVRVVTDQGRTDDRTLTLQTIER